MSKSTFEIWRDARFDQGERLVAFEKWVAEQLLNRLHWPKDVEKAKKQVLQCRALVLQAVADMERHGFLFQPKTIAKLITEKLDEIGERQKRGEIQELYPYLKITWRSYVTGQADQLKEKALSLGTHISQVAKIADSIPVLVAEDRKETLREKKAKAARRKQKACSDSAELLLPLFRDDSRR